MEVRRSSEATVPPRIVKRVCDHTFESGSLKICGDLVSHQTHLAKQQRGYVWIRWIVKRLNEEPRAISALLVNVVNDLWEPFLPEQARDELGLFKVEHEPVAIVIVTG